MLARVLGYGISSSALLVLNKVCVTAIPNVSLLLFIQILSTVLLILVYKLSGYARVNLSPGESVIRAYWLVALVFLGTVYSNFQVVHAIGVNAFIVLRCATPIVVSFLDFMFLNRQLPQGRSLLSLVGIFITGVAYAYLKYEELVAGRQVTEQTSPGFRGLAWSAVWLTCFVADMIYIKHVADSYECTGLERTMYQNTLALPVILVSVPFSLEATGAGRIGEVKNGAVIALGLSCVAGAILSYTGMSLRTDLSATSFSVLGVVCKMGSAALNEIFVSKETNKLSLVCISGVIISSSMFQQSPLREAHKRVGAASDVSQDEGYVDFGVSQTTPARLTGDAAVFIKPVGGSPWRMRLHEMQYVCAIAICVVLGLIMYIFLPQTSSAEGHFDYIRSAGKNIDQPLCGSFAWTNDSNRDKSFVTMDPPLYGRLGNRLSASSHMIAWAEQECCDVHLPNNILDGWKPPALSFENTNCVDRNSALAARCGSIRSSEKWFRLKQTISPCVHHILKQYFAITATHALGRACPDEPFAALHIRSGDVAAGSYNASSGVFQPRKVNRKHWLYPTSFYAAVLKNLSMRAVVFCENLANPSCDFFQKLSDVDPNIRVRVGEPLIEDLHLMLCATEVAASHGTFKGVFTLSEALQELHLFLNNLDNTPDKMNCAQAIKPLSSDSFKKASTYYWIKDTSQSVSYRQGVVPWKNSGFQRYVVNKRYDIDQCRLAAPSDDQTELDDLFSFGWS